MICKSYNFDLVYFGIEEKHQSEGSSDIQAILNFNSFIRK